MRGFSLLETMFALSILAIIIASAGAVLVTTSARNQMAREDIAASQAARARIAEIRSLSISEVVSEYSSPNNTFPVKILKSIEPGEMGLVVNGEVQNEGEVVLIMSEQPQESAFGRDLDGDGHPDGISLNDDQDTNDIFTSTGSGDLFPLDLNLDGDTDDTTLGVSELELLPVIVCIRWKSQTGKEGRVQMMTLLRRK